MRLDEADTLSALGDVYLAAGKQAEARQSWDEALEILVEMGDPQADGVRAKLGRLAHDVPPAEGG